MTILRKELADLLSEEDVPHGAACAITEKLVQRVVDQCGGDRVPVPKIDRAKRDEAILLSWRAGVALAEIARQQSVPLRTVYRVIGIRQKSSGDSAGFGSADWNL